MNKKDNDEIIELTEDELSEILKDDDFDSEGEHDEFVPSIFQIQTHMPRLNLAPLMRPSMIFPSMKKATSS